MAVTGAACLLVGAAGGRLTAPEGDVLPTAGPGGVQVGFPQTPGGARAAALSFTTARMRSVLLPAPRRVAMFRAIGTSAFVAAALREDEQEDLSAVADSAPDVRYLTSGLGTKLERYATDAGSARVVVWALRSLSGVALPVASFATQVVDLQWLESGWRVTAMREADRQAVPRVLQRTTKQATNVVLRDVAPASYGTP